MQASHGERDDGPNIARYDAVHSSLFLLLFERGAPMRRMTGILALHKSSGSLIYLLIEKSKRMHRCAETRLASRWHYALEFLIFFWLWRLCLRSTSGGVPNHGG
jgi:hypothetical protein